MKPTTSALIILAPAVLSQYQVLDTFVGQDFLTGWNWETFDDPTNGRVNFVDQTTALSNNLSFVSETTFVMRADASKVVQPGERGRDSIRILSNNAYDDSVIVLDLVHMPEGCASWPAFWTLSQQGPWPQGGEIDIIEGINLNPQNLASLHTTPQCNMSTVRLQSGTTVSTDCDTSVNSNQGCGTSFTRPNSYGLSFNDNGGGWYVMQKSINSGVSVWFWSRDDVTVPREVRDGLSSLSPGILWGVPDATFPVKYCDYESHFNAHQIVFDLTFCGDWAGSSFPSSGCGPSSCSDYVDNNPSSFSEAYWEVNSLRVYTLQ